MQTFTILYTITVDAQLVLRLKKLTESPNIKKNNRTIDTELKLKNNGILRKENYVNAHTDILWECKQCHHEWRTDPSSILHSKHGCPRCNKRERVTNETIDTRILETNRTFTRMDDSRGSMQKLQWRCNICEGIWTARPNDIFSIHKSGCPYCKKKNYSKMAIQWLTEIEQKQQINIIHAGKGGEYKIPGTRFFVDGYCKETNTVYEFHGDAFHGNSKKFEPTDHCHPFDPNLTAGELYNSTIKRENKIKQMGFNLIVIWESDWKSQPNESGIGASSSLFSLYSSSTVQT